MRSHGQIIAEAGVSRVAALLDVASGTVKQWKRGDSIPAAYWKQLATSGLTTLVELASAAELKRRAGPVAA